jgi:RNA polymerase sigma-70 factor (ECF subfamily)
VANSDVTSEQIDFDRLFQAHADAVYGYTLRMVGDPDRAADISQDTFIKAHRQLGTLSSPDAARTWLFRIASRTAIDEIRRRRWTHPFGSDDFDRPDPAPGPEGQAMARRLDDRLQRSLLRLKPAQRQCLVLSDVEDMAAAEIGLVMEMTPGAVRTLLSRARAEMRRLLAEEGLIR